MWKKKNFKNMISHFTSKQNAYLCEIQYLEILIGKMLMILLSLAAEYYGYELGLIMMNAKSNNASG